MRTSPRCVNYITLKCTKILNILNSIYIFSLSFISQGLILICAINILAIIESVISKSSLYSPVISPFSRSYLFEIVYYKFKYIYLNVKSSLNLCFSSRLGGLGIYSIPFEDSMVGLFNLYSSFNLFIKSLNVSFSEISTCIFFLPQTRQF